MDATKPILDRAGQPMKTDDGTEATIGGMLITAIDTQYAGANTNWKLKLRMHQLAMDIYRADVETIVMDDEMKEELRTRAAALYPVLVFGRISEALDKA